MTRDQLDALFTEPSWFEKYGQPVIDQLLLEIERGKSANEIAIKLGLSPELTLETLRQLNRIDLAESPLYSNRWHADENAIRSITDKRYRPKERSCMTCKTMFLSAGAHNRLCWKCNDSLEHGHMPMEEEDEAA